MKSCPIDDNLNISFAAIWFSILEILALVFFPHHKEKDITVQAQQQSKSNQNAIMLYGILKPDNSILSSARTFEAFSSMVGAYEGFTVVGAVLGDVLGPADGG